MMEPKLKDSGIPWIGLIPEEWNVSIIGQLYDNRYERVSDKDYEPLSVTMQGILPQLETAAKTDDGDNRKLVKKGDFAINSRSDRRGSCGISPQDGSVSLINLILAPRTLMNADYYNWMFHTSLFADEFYSWGHGIVADLWTTRWQEMKNIAIPVPTLEEQERIAGWLDEKCGEIDELVEVEQQMISDLEAYRQAVITEAVTHGLNEEAAIKETPVQWLPSIPKHWELSRIGLHFSLILGKMLCTKQIDYTYHQVPYFCAANVHFRELDKENLKTMWFSTSEMSQYLVKNGDLLIVEGGAGAGGCCLVRELQTPTYVQNSIIIVREQDRCLTRYLAYFLEAMVKQDYIDLVCNKATFAHFTKEKVANTPIPLPPLAEQQEIAEYLDGKCAEIDEVIKVKQEKIETLKQYRQSLIFEAVTGKISIN